MKIKSCNNCRYLEYIEDDSEAAPNSGFCCNKRYYQTELEERRHLYKLQDDSYRDIGKKCHQDKLKEVK